ncbi:hypothetical protein E2C01_100566 [Portunus trituberculatus]|uniref:Uncharacterized protein n=1 Tax=Portunus trituberculatus TaxID=210409 RepID=A0A5B7KJT1_PORTR|nr:hypothetical protein [Portunus trituberculatus]
MRRGLVKPYQHTETQNKNENKEMSEAQSLPTFLFTTTQPSVPYSYLVCIRCQKLVTASCEMNALLCCHLPCSPSSLVSLMQPTHTPSPPCLEPLVVIISHLQTSPISNNRITMLRPPLCHGTLSRFACVMPLLYCIDTAGTSWFIKSII